MKTLQLSINGKDQGGYVFQNVLHFNTEPAAEPTNEEILQALLSEAFSNIIPLYLDCMVDASSILTIGAKIISVGGGYTLNKSVNTQGTRVAVDPQPGAICGRLAFLPAAGAAVGHLFVAGPGQPDYVADTIQTAYATLLQALGDQLVTYDGTDATYHWSFVIWNRKTTIGQQVVDSYPMNRVGVLSKRVRA